MSRHGGSAAWPSTPTATQTGPVAGGQFNCDFGGTERVCAEPAAVAVLVRPRLADPDCHFHPPAVVPSVVLLCAGHGAGFAEPEPRLPDPAAAHPTSHGGSVV